MINLVIINCFICRFDKGLDVIERCFSTSPFVERYKSSGLFLNQPILLLKKIRNNKRFILV